MPLFGGQKEAAICWNSASSIRTIPSAPGSNRFSLRSRAHQLFGCFTAGGDFHPAPKHQVYYMGTRARGQGSYPGWVHAQNVGRNHHSTPVHYAIFGCQYSSQRLPWIKAARLSICWTPAWLHLIPACLCRLQTICLQALST